MRIFIFEEDPSLLNLLTLYLENKGHTVQGFQDQYTCPLYRREACTCPAKKPCADAVIVSTGVLCQENIQILIDQHAKGCKLPNLNKAIMSGSISKDWEDKIRGLGFTAIQKPFRLATINDWLADSRERVTVL